MADASASATASGEVTSTLGTSSVEGLMGDGEATTSGVGEETSGVEVEEVSTTGSDFSSVGVLAV